VIEIFLSALVAIQMFKKEESSQNDWEILSNLVAILSLIAVLVTPIWFIRLITKYRKDVDRISKVASSPGEVMDIIET
jgi:hypothetical protein